MDLQYLNELLSQEITVSNLVLVVVILVLARLMVWGINKLIHRLLKSRRIPLDSGRTQAIVQIVKYLIYFLAILTALTTIGVNLSLLIASSAALLVGLGFGLQQVFNDFLSGIFILLDGTIEVGDVIEVNSLGLAGKVIEIRLRTSIIETPESINVIIPNSKFTGERVVNWSHNDRETRFSIRVGVAYGSDVSLVRDTLKEAALSHGLVLRNPEPRVFFSDFGDSALVFDLHFWTYHHFEIKTIKSDLRYKVEAEFRRHNITIPFPQRDVYLRNYQDQTMKKEEPIGEKSTHHTSKLDK